MENTNSKPEQFYLWLDESGDFNDEANIENRRLKPAPSTVNSPLMSMITAVSASTATLPISVSLAFAPLCG